MLSQSTRVASLALVLTLGAAACGGRIEEGARTGCAAYAAAVRDRAARCGDVVVSLNVPEGWEELCLRQRAAPGDGLTEERLGECAAALERTSCGVALRMPECAFGEVMGALPAGSACASGTQCASGNCARTNAADACGTCRPRVPVGGDCTASETGRCVSGAQCAASTPGGGRRTCVAEAIAPEGGTCAHEPGRPVACARGLECTYENGTYAVCREPVGEGAVCTTRPCGGELVCLDGTCRVRGQVGARCRSTFDCAFGLDCDPRSKACIATAGRDGERCASGPEPCAQGLYCDASRVCRAYTPRGARCDAITNRCAPTTRCVDGTCTVLDPSACR